MKHPLSSLSPGRVAVLAVAAVALFSLPALAAPVAETLASDPVLAGCAVLRSAPAAEASALPFLEPAPADHPPLLEQCMGKIRPGAPLGYGWCTMNFVFKDATGSLYVGTAGHCVSRGERVSSSGVGYFGSVVHRVLSGVRDFALIKIDADKHHLVDPTMCQWGGPVAGMDPGSSFDRDVFYEYGWGYMTNSNLVTRARALVETTYNPTYVEWAGMGSGGDSGAPIVNQAGYAVGIHTYGQTSNWGVYREGGPSFPLILAIGREAVPTLELVPGDPSSLENLGADLSY